MIWWDWSEGRSVNSSSDGGAHFDRSFRAIGTSTFLRASERRHEAFPAIPVQSPPHVQARLLLIPANAKCTSCNSSSVRPSSFAYVRHKVRVIDEVAITQEVASNVLAGASAQSDQRFFLSQEPTQRPSEVVEIVRVA